MVRVPFDIGPITPYAIGRIGYGVFSGTSDYNLGWTQSGGLYYSVGGGIDLRLGGFSIFAEAAYSVDDGSLAKSGQTANITYSSVDVSAGL